MANGTLQPVGVNEIPGIWNPTGVSGGTARTGAYTPTAEQIAAAKAATPTGGGGITVPMGGGASNALQQMQAEQYARGIQSSLKPGMTANVTYPTYQEPSGTTLNLLRSILGTDPYAGVHQAYEDVARQMAGAFQQRGSQGARTQQQAALSTGLTPLEASGAGESALLDNMRAYFAALPQLRLQQAMLPAQRQEQLGGLLGLIQGLYQTPGPTYQYGMEYQDPFAALKAAQPTAAQVQGGTPGQAATPAQGATVPGYSPGTTSEDVLRLAQAAQLQQVTSARQKMNELFYGGGLGPMTAGGMETTAGGWPSQYGPVAGGGATPAGSKGTGQYPGTPASRQAYEDIVLSSTTKRGT